MNGCARVEINVTKAILRAELINNGHEDEVFPDISEVAGFSHVIVWHAKFPQLGGDCVNPLAQKPADRPALPRVGA